jgi:hypothetical protein
MRVNRGEPGYQRGEFDTEKRVDLQIHGRWWVPGDEQRSSAGLARMLAEGLVWLDLFADPWLDVSNAEASRDLRTVYGETSDGIPMSLHVVRFIGGQEEPFIGRSHVRYVAERLIYGAHADGEDDVSTDALSLSYRGLREWLLSATQGKPIPLAEIVTAPQPGTDEPPPSRTDEWELRSVVDVAGVEVEMSAGKRRGRTSRFRSEYDTSAVLRMKAAEPLTLAQWRLAWIQPLRDLVLFGTREQTVVLYTHWRDPELGGIRCGVYLPPDTQIGPPDHSEYHQRDLLPSGIWGQEGFGALIESWRSLYLSLGSVATTLFEVFNTVDMPPLTRLLRLTACAEGYHRVLHSEPPFTDEAHTQMVNAMLEALPNDNARKLYRAPLTYANEQSQRKRLRWLITRAAAVDNRLGGRANEITGRLVDWRNDQTHLDEAREAPQLDDLLLLNAVLTYVLEANILLDLHLDVEDVGYCLAHGHAWDNPIPAWLDAYPAPRSSSPPTR